MNMRTTPQSMEKRVIKAATGLVFGPPTLNWFKETDVSSPCLVRIQFGHQLVSVRDHLYVGFDSEIIIDA
jgi:hypothetical protein